MDKITSTRMIGGNPEKPRSETDFYPTPPEATIALLNFLNLKPGTVIWEPACGQGHMSNVMKEYGYCVLETDLQLGVDFLQTPCKDCDWIITNPPFSVSEQFIKQCVKHGKPFAFLLKSQYWHAKKRLSLFAQSKPSYILPLTWRPNFLFQTNKSGKSLMDVMWVIWDGKYPGYTRYEPLNKPY